MDEHIGLEIYTVISKVFNTFVTQYRMGDNSYSDYYIVMKNRGAFPGDIYNALETLVIK